MKRSKAYRAAADKIDDAKLYAPLEAVRLAKETASNTYDATVEVAFRLGVDPRKADQMVRGTVNLPHGTGKTARVLVFANGDKAEAARAAGADFVGSDDLLEKVQGGWLDFDAVVAISRTWSRVIRPTLVVCGTPEPLVTPAAFLISSAAGGVLVTKVKVRSSKIVISTGMTLPRCDSVAAL